MDNFVQGKVNIFISKPIPRDEAIRIIEMVMARNVDALFDAGSRLDQACENCHLEYWYPGDKETVLRERRARVTFERPAASHKTPPDSKR